MLTRTDPSLPLIMRLLAKSVAAAMRHRALLRIINQARLENLRRALRACGDGLVVQFPISLQEPSKVRFGKNVSIAAYVHLWGGGEITIGDRVMIGTHTSISSLTHDYAQREMFRTLIRRPVWIGSDVWIGSNCVILPGIRIGSGAVVGAGSVVTRDVPPDAIVAGVPARVMKRRLNAASTPGTGDLE